MTKKNMDCLNSFNKSAHSVVSVSVECYLKVKCCNYFLNCFVLK